jgi:hypothetical protein
MKKKTTILVYLVFGQLFQELEAHSDVEKVTYSEPTVSRLLLTLNPNTTITKLETSVYTTNASFQRPEAYGTNPLANSKNNVPGPTETKSWYNSSQLVIAGQTMYVWLWLDQNKAHVYLTEFRLLLRTHKPLARHVECPSFE